MKQKGILIKVLSVLAAFIIFGYFAVQIYEMIGRNYATRTAYIQTVTDSVDAEMIVIRDEVILDSGGSGVIVPIAVNGERVSRGSEIAASFPSEQSAENYSLLRNLNKKLTAYKKISSQLRLANLDIDKLSDEIDADFISMLNMAYNNDYSSVAESELAFAEKLSRKQISLGQTVDCSEAIASLESQIASLSASSTPSRIVAAESAGYYVSNLDGYEGLLTAQGIDSLTAESLQNALDSGAKSVPEQSLGKIISGFNWYVACIIDNSVASQLKTNGKCKLKLGDLTVETSVYAVKPATEGKNLAIFKCNLMNEQLATLRRFSGSVILNEYTGLRVSKDAVRVDKDGVTGVYVRLANIVEFRVFDTLYSTDEYIITDEPSDSDILAMKKKGYQYLKLYDEVFVSGKDLKDGMVIG